MKIIEWLKCFTVKRIYTTIFTIFGIFGTITGIVAIFDIPDWVKYLLLGLSFGIPILIGIIIVSILYSKRDCFNINGNLLSIENGDIFKKVNDSNFLTIINFDNRFNTRVDDIVISKSSIHGQYINKYWNGNIEALDNLIENDLQNREVDPIKYQDIGKLSKQKLYGLGTYVNDCQHSTILVGFSQLDCQYKAKLNFKEYRDVLFKVWDDIDCAYGGRDVYMPLLGNGIVRICDVKKDPTELLEIILNTFKFSDLKLHSDHKIHIILRKNDYDKVDFIHLKKKI